MPIFPRQVPSPFLVPSWAINPRPWSWKISKPGAEEAQRACGPHCDAARIEPTLVLAEPFPDHSFDSSTSGSDKGFCGLAVVLRGPIL